MKRIFNFNSTVLYPAQDAVKETARGMKERITLASKNDAQPSKEKTSVRYQSLATNSDAQAEDGKMTSEYTEDKDEPARYYDCFDRCSRCSGGCACVIPTRYVTSLLASLGFLIAFGIRCNLGIAMIQMTKVHNITTVVGNQSVVNHTVEFPWNKDIQGVLDSSFFWGYILTQIPGGYLTSILPANRIFGCAITASAFLNLFLPSALKLHYGAGVAVRITQGLVEGVTYPACHGIWRFWAPPLERSKLATIAFCGSYAGAVVGLPLSGVLTDNLGWESCFYFYGALGLIWGVVWWFMSHERPSAHPRIDPAERLYIEESLGLADNTAIKFQHTPWKSIFTSMPVYAIIVANICRSWTFYLLILSQTNYFTEVFHMTIAGGSLMGCVPHLVMACIVPVGGYLADMFRHKGILSTTSVRKIFNCGGFGLEATFMLIVGFTQSHTVAYVCLVLAVGSSGFAISGYNVNHLDIAPRYASILMGISNGVGTLSGILCPVVTNKLTEDKTNPKVDWQWVFLIAGILHYLGVIFYAIFASGEKQDWANPRELQEEEAKDNISRYGSVYGSQHSLHSRNFEPRRSVALESELAEVASTSGTTDDSSSELESDSEESRSTRSRSMDVNYPVPTLRSSRVQEENKDADAYID